jgi:hypothetical protein
MQSFPLGSGLAARGPALAAAVGSVDLALLHAFFVLILFFERPHQIAELVPDPRFHRIAAG